MEATIEIRQWRNEIALPRDHPAPFRVRDAIDAAAALVGETLAGVVGTEIDRRAGEVILVRDLVFDCNVDVACDRHTLVRALARRCASALMHAVESGSPEVVRFSSRAALVAKLISDVAAGDAWGRWYYRAFEGLAALPTSAVIRTALLEDRAAGREALTLVPESAWPVLAQALEFDDAIRVLDALVEDDAQPAAFAPAAWIAAFDTMPQRDLVASPHVMALQFFAKALARGKLGSSVDADAALMLAAIAVFGRAGDEHALHALQRGDTGDLARLEPALAPRIQRSLTGPQSGALRTLIHAVRASPTADDSEVRQDPACETLDASFAGLGLLIEEVGSLLDRDVSSALARVSSRPARELAALTAIACAAGTDAHRVWRDPAFRALFGIAPDLAWSEYEAALRDSKGASAQSLEALWISASRHARGDALDVPLRFSGASMICTLDASTDLWLRVRERDGCMTSGPVRFSNRLAAARGARADVSALDTGSFGAQLPRDWRVFFTAIAQIALRRITQRIPGMRHSSLNHLHANVLCIAGQAVAIAPDCWRWRARRPPLHVLLALSGIARSEQRWQGPAGERRVVQWDWS